MAAKEAAKTKFESIKVRWTGKARSKIKGHNLDAKTEKSDVVVDVLDRQKTNAVIESAREAALFADGLSKYTAGRSWMNTQMENVVRRVGDELAEEMESRGYETRRSMGRPVDFVLPTIDNDEEQEENDQSMSEADEMVERAIDEFEDRLAEVEENVKATRDCESVFEVRCDVAEKDKYVEHWPSQNRAVHRCSSLNEDPEKVGSYYVRKIEQLALESRLEAWKDRLSEMKESSDYRDTQEIEQESKTEHIGKALRAAGEAMEELNTDEVNRLLRQGIEMDRVSYHVMSNSAQTYLLNNVEDDEMYEKLKEQIDDEVEALTEEDEELAPILYERADNLLELSQSHTGDSQEIVTDGGEVRAATDEESGEERSSGSLDEVPSSNPLDEIERDYHSIERVYHSEEKALLEMRGEDVHSKIMDDMYELGFRCAGINGSSALFKKV